MNKVKKGLSMIMVYLMVISLLPIGLFTVIAKAQGEVPKYLNYSELYFTSVAQYKDKTLVTYHDTKEDPNYNSNYNSNYNNFMQLSLFQNGEEIKVSKNENTIISKSINDVAYYYQDTIYNSMKYNFSTGEIKQDIEQTENILLTDVVKKDIVDKVNEKYKTNYTVDSSKFYYNEKFNTLIDTVGNKYLQVDFYGNGDSSRNYHIIYNKDNSYVQDNNKYNCHLDHDNNLIIVNLEKDSFEDLSVMKIKNNNIISKGTLKGIIGEKFLSVDGDYAYTMDYNTNQLKSYKLKDGVYEPEKVILEEFYGISISYEDFGMVSGGNIWFLRKEGDRNFVFKIENGEAVKKYEVAPFMEYLKVYDDNNLVVTSKQGSTIINATTTDTTVVTKPTTSNENGTTTSVVDKITPNAINVINISNEEKEVIVNLKDIQAIKDGKGSALINLSNGTKINVPFSVIDKALLEGATNVKIIYNTIDNSDLVKGLNAVNKVFDFNLQIEYGDTVKSIHDFKAGVAEVTLALTDEDLKGLDRTKIKVLYYNEVTKKYEVMETKVEGNNITFKTPHFSKFIVAEVNDSGQPIKSTSTVAATSIKTGDANSNRNIIMIGAFALISLAVVVTFGYTNLKKNKVKS